MYIYNLLKVVAICQDSRSIVWNNYDFLTIFFRKKPSDSELKIFFKNGEKQTKDSAQMPKVS